MNNPIEQLKEKIELFCGNLDDYKNKNYDEYNTRADFIDSLFSALGWDMYNEQGVIEQFREVVREDKVEIEGRKKAPDYSFRIGQQIIFYVEAKKPSVDIKNDPEPAYQLRRYAYTQGLKLSILTDFEEIAVYDARIKPEPKDSAGIARTFYCTYDELFEKSKVEGYETNFDFLFKTFGKQAVLTGSFNQYAEKNKNKKGTESVDKGFLNLLNTWRESLAVGMALKNEELDEYNLNIAVQKIIDRLIFLRIAEDRLIEKPNHLQEIASGDNILSELFKIFDEADRKYNSSLFLSEEWLKNLTIEDKALKAIIDEMYYPKCPYEFSVLPLEILGQAYEQFLGKTIKYIRKTKYGHKVEIEEKPEVRKAGGVYYTPQYIVNYIVENTVGEKLKGKKPEEIEKIRILDPACGSGSFLIGAYNYILKYYLEFCLKSETQKKKALKEGVIYQTGKEKYKLSTAKKSEILVNNIYGVDIDHQAVEVTKLSLLLKVLEDENLEYKEQLFKADAYHLLPDLSNNIKCGNSLIGSDFYEDKNMSLFDDKEMRKINTFDWDEEFSEISKNGGFDCVIGNPPYGAALSDSERKHLDNKYKLKNTDTACLFMGLSTNFLSTYGINGFIIPKPFVYSSNWRVIRELFLENITEIVDCSKVWKQVKLEQVIYFYCNNSKSKSYISSIRDDQNIKRLGKIDKAYFNKFGFYLNGISEEELSIGIQLNNSELYLNDLCINQRGAPYQKFVQEKSMNYKVLGGKQLNRYHLIEDVKGYISKNNIENDKAIIKDNSILVQNIVAHIQNPIDHIKIIALVMEIEEVNKYMILDTINQFSNTSFFSRKYILGILNSKLISWYCYRFIFGKAIRTMHFDNAVTSRIPYPNLNLQNPIEKERHNHLVALVDQMLETQKKLHSTKTDNDKKLFQQKVDVLDKQIDKLVYELYGLTDEEIEIVEGSV